MSSSSRALLFALALTLYVVEMASAETLCGGELVDALQFVCEDRGFYFSKFQYAALRSNNFSFLRWVLSHLSRTSVWIADTLLCVLWDFSQLYETPDLDFCAECAHSILQPIVLLSLHMKGPASCEGTQDTMGFLFTSKVIAPQEAYHLSTTVPRPGPSDDHSRLCVIWTLLCERGCC